MHSEYAQRQKALAVHVFTIAYGKAGTTGFITGGLFATLKSSPIPGLFALGTGFNCFVIGSTYWGQLLASGNE